MSDGTYSQSIEIAKLQARVRELENALDRVTTVKMYRANEALKYENARLVAESALKSTLIDDLGKHVSRLRKVVDAARMWTSASNAEENFDYRRRTVEALRKLDGEKKCDSCGMPDSDPKSVICNDGFHTPKD